MKQSRLIVLFLLALIPLVFAFVFWENIPASMVIHTDIQGRDDLLAPKEVAVFLMPLISIFCFLLIEFPLAAKKFSSSIAKKMTCVNIVVAGFLSYFGILLIIKNIKFDAHMDVLLYEAFGIDVLLIVLFGMSLGLEQNKIIGVRNRWTLQSEIVWRKVNRHIGILGVFLFLALTIATPFLLPDKFFVILMLLIVFLFSYSYVFSFKVSKMQA